MIATMTDTGQLEVARLMPKIAILPFRTLSQSPGVTFFELAVIKNPDFLLEFQSYLS